MSTPVFNNGILLRDTQYHATSDVDSFHLLSMMRDSKPMDMGMIDLWAMTQKVEMPLYQMSSFDGKNTIEVDNERGEYKWETPITQDLPYVIEDIESGNATKGIDGQTFKVKFNKREFGYGDIITYDKFNGLELYVVPNVDIVKLGSEGFVYTLQIVNNDSGAFLDNKYLANGTKYFRVSSATGEYGERLSSIQINSGMREFYNYVGQTDAHSEYSVTTPARMMIDGHLNKDGTVPVTEIWRNFTKEYNDPSITSIEQLVTAMGAEKAKKAVANGDLQKSFLTNLEAAHITKVARDIEHYLMWGKGGRIQQHDGNDDLRLSVGLWKQLDSSFKRVYNKANFSLEMFRAELYNFYAGKVDFTGPDPERDIIIQTGIGGMRMVNEAIKNEANGSGLIIQAADNDGVGAITGKGMNLGFGFAYTSYKFPFLANVHFVINPAFDNLHTNDIENPQIDGYPLSSYNFIVFDITDNTNDNIYLLKLKWDNQLKWLYRNGTMDYMGRTQGFQSSGRFSGYEVEFRQKHQAIWVKDPTKVLKIVMKNPITGGSF